MTLSRRLITMVAACISLAVITACLIFGWLGRSALVQQAEGQARGVARIVAESARLTEISFEEMKALVTDDLATLAYVVANVPGLEQADYGALLAEVVARSNLSVLWLVNDRLEIVASSRGNFDALIRGEALPDEISRPGLEALVRGQRFSLSLGTSTDGFQYVGARVDSGGAVIAGQSQSVLDPVRAANSLPVLLGALIQRQEIEAIMVFDDGQRPSASVGATIPQEAARVLAAQALDETSSMVQLREERLLVAAPIHDTAGIAIGAVVLSLSTKPLGQLLLDYLLYGLSAAAATLAAGVGAAGLFSDRIARPVAAMTRAAKEIDARIFKPESLDSLAKQSDELGVLARVFQNMAVEVHAREERLEAQVKVRTMELQQKNLLLEESQRRVEAELDAARSLQAAILPQTMPQHPAYSGKATMVPARELGGDFYDFFMLDDHRLGIVIADVSGKGVPAAFFMAIARTVLHASARDAATAGDSLAAANDSLCQQNPMDLFVTTFYGILDTTTGVLTYANGGHNPPFVVQRSNGMVVDLPRTGGIALGVMAGVSYQEKSITLGEGDTLFLYTDGISEAMDSAGQEFSDERLRQALADAHQHSVELVLTGVTHAVEAFVGGAEQSDDITCLVVRYNGLQKMSA